MQDIIIHEVGMRDGLQVEKEVVPFEQKVKWIEKLISSGIDVIQIGSFVHPTKVPQMADTDKLFLEFNRHDRKSSNVILSGLVLNEKGMERGMACGVDMFCMGVSASDTHSRKNTGMSTAEATERIIAMGKKAIESGKRVQVSVQSAFGCGYEGEIPEERVLGIVKEFLNSGFKIISLADTSGYADPEKVERMYDKIFRINDKIEYACHFHDTYGLGLANCYAAMKTGVKYFESAFAGLGGCPFTAVTSGNVCTEDFIHLLQRINLRTDIKIDSFIEIAKEAEEFFKRDLPGRVHKMGPISKIV
jgi:hydroxymethylglutaryl-CoA lyase